MRTGTSLVELAQILEAQTKSRQDYVAPQGAVAAKVLDGEIVVDGINGTPFGITNHAHGQIADHLGIPTKYYNRMRQEQPALLTENINTWLKSDANEKRMVRTLNGRVRAFLSPKYRPLDNFQLTNAVLPTLIEHNVQIVSTELTETRLYIKGILPNVSEELPEGLVWGSGHTDITKVAPGLQLPPEQVLDGLYGTRGRGRIVAAIVISNSEVGAGTLRIEPSVFTTWCTNLAILVAAAMKKYHVGRAWEADGSYEVFEDDTRRKDDEAFFLKVRDVTKAAFDRDRFAAAVEQIRDAGGKTIDSDNLKAVVDTAVQQLALPVGSSGGILSLLARGGDLSKWGLSSAITAAANTADNYELATQLEYAGGKVLALDGKAWDTIAKAA